MPERSAEAEARMQAKAEQDSSEVWMIQGPFNLRWAMLRAREREAIRGKLQTIGVVRWRDGYPHWVIEDEFPSK